MNFKTFKNAVASQFERMKKHDLYRTGAEKDQLWNTYLGSFPAGSDLIYKERTEHDCNSCKQFIRAVGNVVAIIDGKLESIWDISIPSEPSYQTVANGLSALVKSSNISDLFLHFEKVAGTDRNFQDTIDGVQTWEHFFIDVPAAYVVKGADIASTLAEPRTSHDVLTRSLNEITDEAIETVLELIAQNTLYRGAEHKFIVDELKKLKKKYNSLDVAARDIFVWSCVKNVPASVLHARNKVIGTLLTDLSDGVALDTAVNSFESKVAPTNYKRPTALITKAMIEKAKDAIEALGLTSALERRYATINDITVNNVLFANRDSRKSMNANVFDALSSAVPQSAKSLDKVDEVTIEKFINDILPRAQSIELMVENRHSANMVSLVAPANPTAPELFKWGNKFSWSYNGELADSIKERVKTAGGNVTGDLCCRLAWFNHDDLDFHMTEPSGYEIYFANRRSLSPSGGTLDVDMNAGSGQTREPVENIVYSSKKTMKEGVYTLKVFNFTKREATNVGFEVEFDFMGTVYHFVHAQAVRDRQDVEVVKFKYTHAGGVEIIKSMPSTQAVRETWGVSTNTFQKVNVMMLSPNFWDGLKVGNKHYFFMLEGCLNEGKARGFFNEFLKEELNVHRKVIEVVGSKMMTVESENQLSGIGFSSTQRNSVLCKVSGNFSRIVKIVF